VHADLLSALKLQNQVVAEHVAIVRSMSRRKRRHPRITAAQLTDVEVSAGKRSSKARIVRRERSMAVRSSGGSFIEREQIIQLVAFGYRNRQNWTELVHIRANGQKAGVRRHDLVIHASYMDDPGSKSLLDNDLLTNEAGTKPFARRASGN
jgi:hypothetical protein